ncbi:putative ABC transporter ATP-binding protein [Candidatus Norongarragalina meridionalis]|nr:putative ABC transporter ATP-binding protein [Candidatus Norongarragalina meridionalis]
MEYAIETEKLTKKYGELTAVDGLDLRIKRGEIFGLLGPNGAGKTTLISMLCTMLEPTSGKARVNGFDVETQASEVRKSIGIVFQDPSLDDELTAWENLDIHGELYGMRGGAKQKAIENALQIVELYDKKDELVKHYSGGMKRRLEIARGLMHAPAVLFLDEPTIGLDPQTRRHIWDSVRKMNREKGVTVILTTHYIDEADVLCGRVGIVDHGKIVACDAPSKLKTKGESLEDVFLRLTGSDIREEKASNQTMRLRMRAWNR